ncbi:MAG: cytidylate kinase-like family protein [Prevotella sp.]|nr:cytidylate kinase-like family protein [Prevotella sp.]
MIITIGRQIGAGGREIAQKLAEEFGCTFYDKELLSMAARESGFSEEFFEQNDEQKGFFRSLLTGPGRGFSMGNFYRNEFSGDNLFQFQSDAIRKAADEGSCVFVGRCADYVLRERDDIVNIFVTANLDDRIRRVQERRECVEDKAQRVIEKGESQRATYYNYYTGKRWGDSASYDLCVNSSLLGIDATVQFIAEFIRTKLKVKN